MNVKLIGDDFLYHHSSTRGLQQMGIEVLYGDWYRQNISTWISNNSDHIDAFLFFRPHLATKYIDLIRQHTKANILYCDPDSIVPSKKIPQSKYGSWVLSNQLKNSREDIGTTASRKSVNEKVDILFINHEESRTGAPKILFEMASASRDIYKIRVVSKARGSMTPEFQRKFGAVIYPQEEHPLLNRHQAAREVLLRVSPRMVYVNSVSTYEYALEAKKLRIPVIFHIHELHLGFKCSGADKIIADIRASSDHFIAVSKTVKRFMITERGFDSRKVLLRNAFVNGSDIRRKAEAVSEEDIRSEIGARKNDFIVVGCGLCGIRKGTDLFLDSYRRIWAKGNKKIKFFWIGDPDSFAEQQKNIRHLKNAPVIFLGEKTNPYPYLKAADIFILPSREDPFPLVVLEAMALGKPVLAFRGSGGSAEQLGDLGFYVDGFSPAKLANKVIALSRKKNALKNISGALVARQRRYDSSEIIPQIQKLFNPMVLRYDMVSPEKGSPQVITKAKADGRDDVPLPGRITIGTTLRCNLRCRMCFNHDRDAFKGADMDFAVYKAIAGEIFPYVKSLELSVAGEPLLSKHIKEEIELANRHSVAVSITTNATRLKDDAIMDIVTHSVSNLMVSFDAVNKKTYEAIRVGANFDEVMASLEKLKAIRKKTGMPKVLQFRFVAMKRNLPELPAWVELAHSLGVDRASVTPMIVHKTHPPEMAAEAPENCPDLLRHNLDLAIAKAKKIGQRFEWETVKACLEKAKVAHSAALPSTASKSVIPPPKPEAEKKTPMHCARLYDMAWIEQNGNVMTCCDPHQQVAGNVRSEPFSKIWNNDIFQTLRKQIREGDPPPGCRNCPTLKVLHKPRFD